MKKLTKPELDKIIRDHKLWLDSNGNAGKCADLRHTDLRYVDLSNVDLRGANLSLANLKCTNLTNANLSNANLSDANLFHTNLYDANLENIKGKTIITFKAGRHVAYAFDNYIKIGCINEPINWWLKNYKEIGKKEGYTSQQIKMYGNFIKLCSKVNTESKVNR